MIAGFVLITASTYAQSSKRTTAINALHDFQTYKEADALKKAKENIDAAAQHNETGIEAKTWKYRGDIYLAAYEEAIRQESEKQKDIKDPDKKSIISYSNAPAGDLQTAGDSYIKAKQLDKKNIYTEDVMKSLSLVQIHLDNKGRADYNAKKSADAASYFEKAFEVSQILGKMDTSLLNNAALSYRLGGDVVKAKSTYQKLIDMGFGKGKTVSILANLYMTENDTVNSALVIRKGRERYPNDIDLLTTETNLFLKQKKNKEALENLKKVIEKNPNDPQLNFALGAIYDNLANPKSDKGADLPQPPEAQEYFTQSETYYKKALELDPNYFDALYNLGALYNNQGVKLYNKSNTIKDAAISAREGKKADEIFKKALPYLEKAHELKPKDKNTMISLKQLYAKTEQEEKYNKIVAELKGN